jgi:L-rhamnonate dehydratase
MRIASVSAIAFDAGFQRQDLLTRRIASPMSRWPRFAERRASWMWPFKKAVVRVVDTDGCVGWSCTNGGEVVALIINRQLARIAEGAEVEDYAALWSQMFHSLLPFDRSGLAGMAVGAVDIALWDLRARRAGVALVDLLGGARVDSMTCYATTTAPEAQAPIPWWGLKAAMPHGPEAGADGLAENVALLRRFREAAGPDRRVMLDAYMAWDADYTLRLSEAATDLDIYWIEDPLPPQDIDGLRRLRARGGPGLRLALGNFCFNRWDCKALLDEGLVDVLQPDVAWAGGVTEALEIIAMAGKAGVPVILHNSYEQPWALALAAATIPDPVVEFVDRGAVSELYGLMGSPPARYGGRIAAPTARSGNRPPPPLQALFDTQPKSAKA